MMPAREDTIVAVSSPPGRSVRGLLRLSGPACRGVLEGLVESPTRAAAEATARFWEQPRRLQPVVLALPAVEVGPARLPLPVLAACFHAPASYTGQDMLEIQGPGHPALLDRLLHAAVGRGARLAEPGEFTFRAFLAGKLDLTQAEGIAATIAATSDSELEAAALLRQGALGRFAANLVDRLANLLALVEAGIDFTDQEDVVPIPPAALDQRLAEAQAALADLLSHSRAWGAVEALPQAVLVGPPSAGKSTLLNALVGRARAVISPLPGTTRDVLREPVTLPGPAGRPVEIMLVDIAGLDQPHSALDRESQQAARRAIEQADLILRVEEAPPRPAGFPEDFAEGLARLRPGVPQIHLRTKIDLAPPPAAQGDGSARAPLDISALTGAGLDDLRQALARAVGERGGSVGGQMLALQPRHEQGLRAALDAVAEARALLAPQRQTPAIDHVELVAGSLRAALDALAGLGGRMTPDEVIGRIFATFCVGK